MADPRDDPFEEWLHCAVLGYDTLFLDRVMSHDIEAREPRKAIYTYFPFHSIREVRERERERERESKTVKTGLLHPTVPHHPYMEPHQPLHVSYPVGVGRKEID